MFSRRIPCFVTRLATQGQHARLVVMDNLLLQRELAFVQRGNSRLGYHESLVRRLKQSTSLQNRATGTAGSWSEEGVLAVAGEDCTLRLFDADRGTLLQSFDPVSSYLAVMLDGLLAV